MRGGAGDHSRALPRQCTVLLHKCCALSSLLINYHCPVKKRPARNSSGLLFFYTRMPPAVAPPQSRASPLLLRRSHGEYTINGISAQVVKV
jgi:hypothetical protein